MPNLKQFIVIELNNEPVIVAPIVTGTSKEYIELKKQADKNRVAAFLKLGNMLADLDKEVENLKKEIAYLKGEN